jgi:hypothetical protein
VTGDPLNPDYDGPCPACGEFRIHVTACPLSHYELTPVNLTVVREPSPEPAWVKPWLVRWPGAEDNVASFATKDDAAEFARAMFNLGGSPIISHDPLGAQS